MQFLAFAFLEQKFSTQSFINQFIVSGRHKILIAKYITKNKIKYIEKNHDIQIKHKLYFNVHEKSHAVPKQLCQRPQSYQMKWIIQVCLG